jgi:CubicO group peptidase (beta-lactamase class C family)
VLAGLIVERITGLPLDRFLATRVWQPLRMRDTGYNPLLSGSIAPDSACTATFRAGHPLLARVAKTEMDTIYRRTHVHGIVHDENACALGGVAGHAGLFSSARDLAVFARMLLAGGQYNGVSLVQPTTLARWTARQSRESSRAIGWDTPAARSSAGRYFSPRSFGHTGFTGTSIWVDPERGLYVVLLTNRVNPTRSNMKHEALRRDIADEVQSSVTDAPLVEWRPRR